MNRLLRIVAVTLVSLVSSTLLFAQGDTTVFIVSYVEASPASRDQVAALLKQLADTDRRNGAVRAEVLQRTTQSHQFVILETWKDAQAFEGRAGGPEAKQLRERLAPLLLAPIDERRCVST